MNDTTEKLPESSFTLEEGREPYEWLDDVVRSVKVARRTTKGTYEIDFFLFNACAMAAAAAAKKGTPGTVDADPVRVLFDLVEYVGFSLRHPWSRA